MKEFDGKVAIVTGAGNGIGRAAALLFAERGARIAASDLDEAALASVIDQIRALGAEVRGYVCDIADRQAVREMIDGAVGDFGHVDCAFNNAGMTHPQDVEWDDDAFDRTIQVNLNSIMQCMKRELHHMLPRGTGSIVNTASVAGMVGATNPSLPGYTASKHAIIGVTRTAAITHARSGIRVNCILPGVTDTNIVKAVKELGPEVRQHLDNYAPMGRMAQPGEVAEAALWLASERASFVTGHCLAVDGGFLAQ